MGGEIAVIVPAPLSEPPSGAIETEQGAEDEVGDDGFAAFLRLLRAPRPGLQFIARPPGVKAHRVDASRVMGQGEHPDAC